MPEIVSYQALPVSPESADKAVLSEGQMAVLSVLVEEAGPEAVIAALITLPRGVKRLWETRSAVATAATLTPDPKAPESAPETDPRLHH